MASTSSSSSSSSSGQVTQSDDFILQQLKQMVANAPTPEMAKFAQSQLDMYKSLHVNFTPASKASLFGSGVAINLLGYSNEPPTVTKKKGSGGKSGLTMVVFKFVTPYLSFTAKPNSGLSVSNDLSSLTFIGKQPVRLHSNSTISITLFGKAHSYNPKAGGWYRFIGFTASLGDKRDDGLHWVNYRASELVHIPNGPSDAALAEMLNRNYSGHRYPLKYIPNEIFPNEDQVSVAIENERKRIQEARIKENKKLEEFSEIPKRNEVEKAISICMRGSLSVLNETNDPYDMGAYIAGRRTVIIPLNPEMVPFQIGDSIIHVRPPEFDPQFGFAEKGKLKSFETTSQEPFEHRAVINVTQQINMMLINGNQVENVAFYVVGRSANGINLYSRFGISNPDSVINILGTCHKEGKMRISAFNGVFSGIVDGGATAGMRCNTTAVYENGLRQRGISIVPFRGFINVFKAIPEVSVEITPAAAIKLINASIYKITGIRVETADDAEEEADLSELVKDDTRYAFTNEKNEINVLTQGRVYNLSETYKLHLPSKKGRSHKTPVTEEIGKYFRLYAMTNALHNFEAGYEEEKEKYFNMPTSDPRKSASAKILATFAKKHSESLLAVASGNRSEEFILPKDVPLHYTIFAISRDLDDPEEYKKLTSYSTEDYNEDLLRELAAEVRTFNETEKSQATHEELALLERAEKRPAPSSSSSSSVPTCSSSSSSSIPISSSSDSGEKDNHSEADTPDLSERVLSDDEELALADDYPDPSPPIDTFVAAPPLSTDDNDDVDDVPVEKPAKKVVQKKKGKPAKKARN